MMSTLVGAYLDLALAYLFLLGATFASFASKVLSFFGLALPCSCDGLFGHPFCAQVGLLLDFPVARVAAVRRAIRACFPFVEYLVSAGTVSSPRCRYAVRFPSDDEDSCCSVASASLFARSLSLPAPPTAAASEIAAEDSLIHRHRWPHRLDSLSDLEMSCSASDGSTAIATGEEEGDKGDQVAMIVYLETKLEEEKGACAALYLELEKERSAAAIAADEAMAMLLRLQKEKAEIEMEARQYQRMVEEKSVYDDEEKQILKEIIVTRESEKHVLERKVEMYKQVLDSEEKYEQELDCHRNFFEENMDSLVASSDDPMLMLQEIYKSIGKKEVDNCFGIESTLKLNSDQACGQKFQEELVLHNFNVHSGAEYPEDIEYVTSNVAGERCNLIEIRLPASGLCRVDSDVDQRGSQSSQNETESSVHDVHVIDDAQALLIEENEKENEVPPAEEASFAKLDEMEVNIRRSSSEITNRIGMTDNNLSDGASYFDFRRGSMSSFDSERRRLEIEVELLRTRLDVIRQGRDRAGFFFRIQRQRNLPFASPSCDCIPPKRHQEASELAMSSSELPFLVHQSSSSGCSSGEVWQM